MDTSGNAVASGVESSFDTLAPLTTEVAGAADEELGDAFAAFSAFTAAMRAASECSFGTATLFGEGVSVTLAPLTELSNADTNGNAVTSGAASFSALAPPNPAVTFAADDAFAEAFAAFSAFTAAIKAASECPPLDALVAAGDTSEIATRSIDGDGECETDTPEKPGAGRTMGIFSTIGGAARRGGWLGSAASS